ncbi:Methylthioribose-1-phosphate isomerase, partial [Actinidia chinensis var. chinensis]
MAITKPLSKKNKTMKKKLELEDHDDHDLEILKAVAQAWHSHSGSSRTANEFDALRLNFKSQPTRFKLEATNKAPAKKDTPRRAHWDFGLSLWDSFEIVSVSKRLEAGLVLEHQFPELDDLSLRIKKRGTESDNSLRNLFNRLSSRRYNEAEIPRHE